MMSMIKFVFGWILKTLAWVVTEIDYAVPMKNGTRRDNDEESND